MSKKDLITKFEEVSLVYRNKIKAKDRPSVKCPQDAFKILTENWDMNQINLIEECKILLLDNKLRLMSIAEISKGGLTETIVDPRIVFSIALKRRANRIILAHNHPSNNVNPSKADIKLTKEFIQIGKLLRIEVADHLIVTENDFCSIATEYENELPL